MKMAGTNFLPNAILTDDSQKGRALHHGADGAVAIIAVDEAAPILTPLKTSSGSTDSSSPLQSTINDRAGFSTLCRVRTARQHRDGDCRHHHAIVERNDPPTL